MRNRIYIKDWLQLKPYSKQQETDIYYIKLSNEIKKAIEHSGSIFIMSTFLNEEELNLLACILASYFEDIISNSNIWNSFVKVHKRLYNKPLPFYSTTEYYEEEINTQDVCFLIWYFLNTIQEEKFASPYNDFINEIAEIVMDVLDEAWINAPENDRLKECYQLDENEEEFYIARNLIDKILFRSYLFFTDTSMKLMEKESEILEKDRNNPNLMAFLQENKDGILNKSHTRLLSLRGNEWAADVLGKEHLLYKDFLNITPKISGYFFYKGQDENDIFLEHIASEKKFKLTKKSYDHSEELKEKDTIIFMGILKWKEEWWFSGVQFRVPFNADLVLDEKNSLESRRAVDFLNQKSKEVKEIIEKQFKAFKDFTNGSQIAFVSSSQVNNFLKEYNEFYNNSLNLSEKAIEKVKESSRKKGFFEKEFQTNIPERENESALIFFNPKSGCEIAFEVNSAFPLPENPYFNENNTDMHLMRLLMDDSISPELTMFCIEKCKKNLPFFTDGIGKKYLEDIDFLLRFWKKDHYHTKPGVTVINLNQE